MLYLYLSFPLILLIVVTIFYKKNLDKSRLPGNAEIIIQVWKSVMARHH